MYDELLKKFPEERDELQSLYYHAMATALEGNAFTQPYSEKSIEPVTFHKHKAWRLGYKHGRFLLTLRAMGLEV